MNDVYVEWMVPGKKNPASDILRVLAYALTAVFLICGLMGFLVLFVPGLIMIGVDYFCLPMLSVEYEYLFCAGELQIDRIYSKEKRKTAKNYKLEQMEVLAEEGSPKLDQYNNSNLKTVDFTSGRPGEKRFVLIIHGGEAREKVYLELGDEMQKALKMNYPSKVNISNI